MTDDPYHDSMTSTRRYAQYEYQLALDCTIPLMSRMGIRLSTTRVLDVGCGGGGLSIAMAQVGAQCLGVDMKRELIAEAIQMAVDKCVEVEFVVADVINWKSPNRQFDLIVLSEVVEHLVNFQNVETVLDSCRELLTDGGYIYVSFPPWFSPFAGHQAGWPQIHYIPWYHLLPGRLKRLIAPRHVSRYLNFARELNHLTMRDFERIIARLGLVIRQRELYHTRPEFRWRYHVPVIKTLPILSHWSMSAEVLTSGAYYLLSENVA